MPSIDIAVHMKQLLALYGPAGPISLGAYYGAAYLLMLLLRLPGSAFAHGEQELVGMYSYLTYCVYLTERYFMFMHH